MSGSGDCANATCIDQYKVTQLKVVAKQKASGPKTANKRQKRDDPSSMEEEAPAEYGPTMAEDGHTMAEDGPTLPEDALLRLKITLLRLNMTLLRLKITLLRLNITLLYKYK